MMIPFVDLHAQYQGIKSEIDAAIAEVIRESGFVRSRFVDEFEGRWAETIGVRHCVSCKNGTDASFIAMRGLGIKAGDEEDHDGILVDRDVGNDHPGGGTGRVLRHRGRLLLNIDASQIEGKDRSRRAQSGSFPCTCAASPPTWKRSWRWPAGAVSG